MRHLTPADYRRMPWRNGGGATTELVIAPESAGLAGQRFLYRVSIADVATDGPFSRFEGYDRHIMMLSGAGMSLDCGVHGRIELRAPFEPHAFSGDWDVEGKLVSGPVRDFNLMVDRAQASSALDVRVVSAPERVDASATNTCILHILEGELFDGSAGDTLVVDAPVELVPRGIVRIAFARITKRP